MFGGGGVDSISYFSAKCSDPQDMLPRALSNPFAEARHLGS